MKNKLLFILSGIGILLGCAAAVVFAIEKPAQPPLFSILLRIRIQRITRKALSRASRRADQTSACIPRSPAQ